MKTIIAGGRDYRISQDDIEFLDSLEITEVVSGGAKGADTGGEEYAEERGIPIIRFNADWDKHGKAAGPIRNREMANYADAVVLFPGGRGTESMYKEAVKSDLTILNQALNKGNRYEY